MTGTTITTITITTTTTLADSIEISESVSGDKFEQGKTKSQGTENTFLQ